MLLNGGLVGPYLETVMLGAVHYHLELPSPFTGLLYRRPLGAAQGDLLIHFLRLLPIKEFKRVAFPVMSLLLYPLLYINKLFVFPSKHDKYLLKDRWRQIVLYYLMFFHIYD